MVLWKNIRTDIFDHVVQVDISKIAYRSAVKPGMEVFITDQYVQYIIGNGDSDIGLVFLESAAWPLLSSPKGREMEEIIAKIVL